MTSHELSLHPDQTFRRVWSALMAFYVAAVLLLQFKGEALRPKEFVPPAADEPPRIARILPSPVDVPPPAPVAVPPAQVKELPPPPLPVEVKKEAPKPEVKKEAKVELKPEIKTETKPEARKESPAPSLPVAPPKPAAEKLAKAERPSSTLPPGKAETLPASPALPSGPPPTESAAPRPTPKEEVKKVGLLGLLGGGKGKASDPSLSQSFSSLKEIPSPSPLPSAPSDAPSSPALSPREKKGAPPAASISPETLEQIRKQTVEAQEKGLVQTRQAAIEENLSEMRATSDGVALNHSAISGIANQNKERLLQLYSRRLRQNPKIKGAVTIEFVISPEGKVLKCQILSTSLSDPIFENEIVKEILQWRFPAGEKGTTTVLYPLSFSPAG